MKILKSMTGATHEAQWILLAWIININDESSVENIKELAFKFRVTQRQIKNSLEYLVREGYLKKIKIYHSQKKNNIYYQLTQIARELWYDTVENIRWWREFQFLCKNIKTSELKFPLQTLQTRLVHVFLISIANPFLTLDETSWPIVRENLGISKIEFEKILKNLIKDNVLSICINQYSNLQLFTTTSPIYQLKLISCMLRLIPITHFGLIRSPISV